MSDEKIDWLTVEQIFDRLGGHVPLDTIRSWIRTGKLPAYRPGRSYLIRKDDFDKFIKKSRTRPENEDRG